jgi:hypothetical protein
MTLHNGAATRGEGAFEGKSAESDPRGCLPMEKKNRNRKPLQFEQRVPNERDAAAIATSRTRHNSRLKRVQVQAGKRGDKLQVASPHTDEAGWTTALHDAFGTTSVPFADRCINELASILRPYRTDAGAADLNAGLAAVDGLKPANEAEALLAVQMAATHNVAIEMLHRSKHSETREAMLSFGALGVKLLRTYTAQIEAFAKLRRGGEQKVIVEHVHVYPGGQAIVGSVQQGPGRV